MTSYSSCCTTFTLLCTLIQTIANLYLLLNFQLLEICVFVAELGGAFFAWELEDSGGGPSGAQR